MRAAVLVQYQQPFEVQDVEDPAVVSPTDVIMAAVDVVGPNGVDVMAGYGGTPVAEIPPKTLRPEERRRRCAGTRVRRQPGTRGPAPVRLSTTTP